ncbi:Membrane protein PTM1 [Ceratocystis lukuohia]|uniref:Membrane protein PTM1 n=1 Tax=Ceratocystis lukuohia TaxID=2019550 RepID=A0ABR4MD77_9PEZI
MRSWLWSMAIMAMSFWVSHAMEVLVDQTEDNKRQCTGMYSKSSWDGPVDPFINVIFHNNSIPDDRDPIVSLLIFEWRDMDLIGITEPDLPGERILVLCDDAQVSASACEESNKGQFVLAPNALNSSKLPIYNEAVHLKDPHVNMYPITKTGYYCVFTEPFTDDDYNAAAVFRNAYGELPATQVPKLPFYGGITILYALVAVYWGFLYYMHRHDILAVQNYITAILVFLVVEMLLTWAFYDYLNRNGRNMGANIFMIIVGILNAGRNSFSFFLLLIVCMGYGVVKPTLGKAMIYARWLAVAHFAFGLIYAVTGLYITPESAGPFLLFVVLPLAATLTTFYVWTLNSLNDTLKNLRERKQNAKEAMYRKLWWCILLSIFITFGFFFINSLSFASVSDPDYVPFHWKTRWFVLDGWLNLVYFADVAWIAYVWRPTANNRRFAMSDEIAQDDDGTFEIADLGQPDGLSDSEDEEANIGNNHSRQEEGIISSSSSMPVASITRSQPQAKPVQAHSKRMSEEIFAVGDGSDEDSDNELNDSGQSDDDSDEENAKLVRGQGKKSE